MKFAFAGTPNFASLVLRELIELGCVPTLVISQPDRPKGRGRVGGSPHAVIEASCHGLDCIQTGNINDPEVAARLRSLGIDTLTVVAFGQLLSRPLLDSFTCLNIHASLLPRYRGAAPIERALMAGEESTGVTIMRITEGLDEGPWTAMVEVPIRLRDDTGSLQRMLAVTGATALAGVITELEDGTVEWHEQTGETSYAHKLGSKDFWLCVDAGAKQAHDQVRALSPAVGAKTILGDTEVKVWRSWPYGEDGLDDAPAVAESVSGLTGRVLAVDGRLFIGCTRGVLEVTEIQPACRARMAAAAYLRGYGGRITGSATLKGPAPDQDHR